MSSLKEKAVKGVIWSAVDRFSAQGIQFVFSILIARLLLPEDYGVIAMLNVFLALSRIFIDSGFGTALIRKIDRTEDDFSTVFYFNIIVSAFFYLVLYLLSPFMAEFYNTPLLEPVTKIVALNLVINSISGIHSTKLSIDINFKSRALVSVISVSLTGIIGLSMAYFGYGVWALVVQSISDSLVRTLLLWIVVKWRPKLVFSSKSFKDLFAFGSKLLLSGLLNTIYNNLYTIVVGKFFTAASLGVYSKANTLAQFPSSNITSVLQSVTFPVLSKMQREECRLTESYKIFLRLSAFVVFPLMIGLAAVADPFIRLVLTDKWEGTIPLLQILCFSLMWYPVHVINLDLLQVKGRSDYFLKLELIKKVILGFSVLGVTIPMGLTAMCLGQLFVSVLSLPINTFYTKKTIGYGFCSQMKDLLPILIHSLLMGVVVYGCTLLVVGNGFKLIIGVLIGAAYYIAGAFFLKFPEIDEILVILRVKRSRTRNNH